MGLNLIKEDIMLNKIVNSYRQRGMIIASSNFLVNKVLKQIDWKNTKIIVLFGAGNGIFIKGMIKYLRDDMILYVFEVNKNYIDKYKIDKNNIIYINDTAEYINKYINEEIDVIISTLPFACIGKATTISIINEAYSSLKKGGHLLQYQYFLSEYSLYKRIFKKPIKISFELINFPPAFIYSIKK